MINTYHTSVAPPPVPPRLNSSQTVLIPAQLPSPRHSKTLIRFLVCVVVLHLLLSFGGFIYLYQIEKMDRPPPAEGKAELQTSVKQETFHRALAYMVVGRKSEKGLTSGYLQWNVNQSVLRNINYFNSSWLTAMQSGDYYVYSRVTFSKSHPTSPLCSTVMLRKSNSGDKKILMKAYCNLDTHTEKRSVPWLCTATQGAVVTLEKGNQLSVWIEHLSLVDYDETATAFGMYRL